MRTLILIAISPVFKMESIQVFSIYDEHIVVE